jgi:hypothetical protein
MVERSVSVRACSRCSFADTASTGSLLCTMEGCGCLILPRALRDRLSVASHIVFCTRWTFTHRCTLTSEAAVRLSEPLGLPRPHLQNSLQLSARTTASGQSATNSTFRIWIPAAAQDAILRHERCRPVRPVPVTTAHLCTTDAWRLLHTTGSAWSGLAVRSLRPLWPARLWLAVVPLAALWMKRRKPTCSRGYRAASTVGGW